MKKTMLVTLVALAALPAEAADRRLAVTDFDRVQVDGPFEVVLTTGKAPSAIVSGSSHALARVSVEVQGRTLRVRPNRSAWGGYPGTVPPPARVVLSTHDLRGASVIGSGSLAIDRAKSMRIDLSVAGSGRIALAKAETDNLLMGLVGSGSITVAGKAKMLKLTTQGTGDVNAQGLAVDDAEITAATAGRIDVAVRRAATVNSSGAGDTLVTGGGACTVKQMGSGSVRCDKYSDQRQR